MLNSVSTTIQSDGFSYTHFCPWNLYHIFSL